MTGYITVSKEEAKRLIDETPGDSVTIVVVNMKTRFHLPTERKNKKIGKEIIDLAKEVGYQDNDFFGVIGCIPKAEEELIKNIMFPKMYPDTPPNYH